MNYTRYMTGRAKEKELEWLDEARWGKQVDGLIDPWLDKLNEISGICTLQSCAGHVYEDGSQSDGEVWIWPCARIARAFYHRAFELVSHDQISEACTVYSPWRQEIIKIGFAGRSKASVDASLQIIVDFFQSMGDV